MAMTGGPAKSQRTDPGSRSQHYYSPARPLARSLPTAHYSLDGRVDRWPGQKGKRTAVLTRSLGRYVSPVESGRQESAGKVSRGFARCEVRKKQGP